MQTTVNANRGIGYETFGAIERNLSTLGSSPINPEILAYQPRFGPEMVEVLANAPADVLFLVSAVSGWEMAIKQSLGRLSVPEDVVGAIRDAGFVRLPIGFDEARVLARLPFHHRDPFDRMLVAQAMVLGVPIVTVDSRIARYQVQIVWE